MKHFRDPELRAFVEDVSETYPKLAGRVVRMSRILRVRDAAIAEAAASLAGESGDAALMGRATHLMARLLREMDEESFPHIQELVEAPVSVRVLWDLWTTPRIRAWLGPAATAIAIEATEVALGQTPGGGLMKASICDVVPETQIGLAYSVPAVFCLESSVRNTRIQVTFEAGRRASRMRLQHLGWSVGGGWPLALRWHRLFWSHGVRDLTRIVQADSRA